MDTVLANALCCPNTATPSIYYHGTNADVMHFADSGPGTNGAEFGGGIYVTNSPTYASIFGKNLIEMHVAAINIADEHMIPRHLTGERAKRWAIENGFDAIRSRKGNFGGIDTHQLVVFHPDQVRIVKPKISPQVTPAATTGVQPAAEGNDTLPSRKIEESDAPIGVEKKRRPKP